MATEIIGIGNSTLTIIDPLENGPVDQKDLFIYVNLKAKTNRRSILQTSNQSNQNSLSSVDNEDAININLIGYKENGDNTYVTTDWTSGKNGATSTIGSDSKTDSIYEGFGITSIEITYNAQLMPKVIIKFIDVRGGGLFDQEIPTDDTNSKYEINSPYALLFRIPPPLFELTVKGFYGKIVKYCLYLIKTNTSFNAATGNFEITGEFLGYTFAFLQDIKVGSIIGAGNRPEGRKILDDIVSSKTVEYPAITLDELLLLFNKLTVDQDAFKKNSTEFYEIRLINEHIKYVKEFRRLFGPGVTQDKSVNTTFGQPFQGNYLKDGIDQLFFRDVGVINSSDDTVKKYNSFRDDIISYKNTYDKFVSQNSINNNVISNVDLPTLADGNLYDTVPEAITKINSIISEEKNNSSNENVPLLTEIIFSARTSTWNLNTGVYVIDLYDKREELGEIEKSLNKAKEDLQTAINEKFSVIVNERLGFKPTANNILGILSDNTEMFLKSLRDICVSAEEQSKNRYDTLNGVYNLDIPQSHMDTTDGRTPTIYAFPDVTDDKTYKNVYLGDIPGVNDSVFPEIKFVQETLDGQVNAENILREFINKEKSILSNNTLSSDNVPIAISYESITSSPYGAIEGTSMTGSGDLNDIMLSAIAVRPFMFNNLSLYDGLSATVIPKFEAASLFSSFVTRTYKDAMNNIPNDKTSPKSLLSQMLDSGIITSDSTNLYYELNQNDYVNKLLSQSYPYFISDVDSSYRNYWDIKLNIKPLVLSQLNGKEVGEFFKDQKQPSNKLHVINFYDDRKSFMYKSYYSLNCFEDIVKNDIVRYYKEKKGRDRKNSGIDSDFDLVSTYSLASFYEIFSNKPGRDNAFSIPVSFNTNSKTMINFTQSTLYTASSNEGKAYLILSSLLLKSHNDFIESLTDVAKVVKVPKAFLLWIGANDYRKYTFTNSGIDILAFSQDKFNVAPTNQYFYITKNIVDGTLPTNLDLGKFRKYFIDWVSTQEFIDIKNAFESNLNNSVSNVGKELSKIDSSLFKEVDFISTYPEEWITTTVVKNYIPKSTFEQYLNDFLTTFKNIYGNNTQLKGGNNIENKTTQDIVNDSDIKMNAYWDYKHIYDTWLAGSKNEKIFNICCNSCDEKSLKDYFKVFDKFYNDIGDEVILNMKILTELVNTRHLSMYSVISKIMTDSYFTFYPLPVFMDYSSPETAKALFNPVTKYEPQGISDGPTFLCIYNGPPSSNLSRNSEFKDDALNINDPTKKDSMFKTNNPNEKKSITAFVVDYGSESQSIFKNVSVTTQETRMTGEYIKLLTNFVQGGGQTKKINKGNEVYELLRSRSYTCTIECFGNFMIQPLTYFQLNNVPFFGGGYMINKTSHTITPHNVSTTFSGIRQTPFAVNIVKNYTSYLNFSFNDALGTGSTFTRFNDNDIENILLIKDQLIGNDAVISNEIRLALSPTSGIGIVKSFSEDTQSLHTGIDIEVSNSGSSINAFGNGIIIDIEDRAVLIKSDKIDSDGYKYYVAYFKLQNTNPKLVKSIRVTKSTILGTGTTINNIVRDPNKPASSVTYYHYEVRRSKNDMSTITDFIGSPEVKILNTGFFSGNKPTKIIGGGPLHSVFKI